MLNPDAEIIAEVKTHSPFGWESDRSWNELFEIANKIGHIISVHTDPRWNGSFDLIKKARSMTDKEILAKGIHKSDREIEQALKAGADWVLVVGRVPSPQYRRRCLVEPENLNQISEIPSGMRAVWNSRDLATGGDKSETFADARRLWDGWLCQASNIQTVEDVDPTANAVLVGTHLMEFARSLEK